MVGALVARARRLDGGGGGYDGGGGGYDDDFPFLPDQKPSESIAENASDSESELA